MKISLDAFDYKAIEILMRRGRATWAELGHALGLSAPAAAERVRKLEEKGMIKGYAAIPDPDLLGVPLLAFIAVTLGNPSKRAAFLKAVKAMPNVLECHHVAGDDDYLLKIRCGGTGDLERLLSRELKDRLGVLRTRTTVVLATAKETACIPLPGK